MNDTEGSNLSLEILRRLREKMDLPNSDAELDKGITVMLPYWDEPLPEDEITHLRDLGITVVLPEYNALSKDRGPLVVGATGFPALGLPLLTGWNEKDVNSVDPVPDTIYASGPTPSKRSGNNKPWYDPERQRRKAKIAKQSKRRNRK